MNERYVPPIKTTLSLEQAARALKAALTSVLGEPPPNTVLALALAKTALETGRWQAIWNFNFGNVKASDRWTGAFTCIVLNEVIDGKVVWFDPRGRLTGNPAKGGVLAGDLADAGRKVPPGHPQTRMRAFATAADGALDYIEFVARGRYADAWQRLLAGDADGYVRALKAKGYFTADVETYARAVRSLHREFLSKLEALPDEEPEVATRDTLPDIAPPAPMNAADAMADFYERAERMRREGLDEMSGRATDPSDLGPESGGNAA